MQGETIQLLILGFAIGFASYTIGRGSIFQEVREYFFNRARRFGHEKIFEFISCPYCISHWIAGACVWFLKVSITGYMFWVDFGITTMFLVGIASLSWATFEKLSS